MKPTYKVKFRRRRENKTDYRKRLALLKSKKIRAVVRILKSQVIVQLIKYELEGDKTLVGVSTKRLEKYGWYSANNVPSSYLAGYLAGLIAKNKGITEAVMDIGRYSKRNKKVFAALKGLVDAGIEISHDPSVYPEEERITGKILEEYAKSNPKAPEFNNYYKKGVDPKKLSQIFEDVKKKIEEEYGN
jgi:large subunit ribosomal protein L18